MYKTFLFIFCLLLLATATPTLAAPPAQTGDGEAYTVQADDWLSKLADKLYGDKLAYAVIVQGTNIHAAQDSSFNVITNPDAIQVGQKLWLPKSLPALTPEILRNATYQGIYEQPVKLTNGYYEGEPFVPNSPIRPRLTFIAGYTAWGDLNGDGVEDAVTLLIENSGGSGVFYYMAAVINQNGQPVNVSTTLLGDRVNVQPFSLQNGEVTVKLITQGPTEPMCCGTLPVTWHYRLQDNKLTQLTPFPGVYKAKLPAADTPGRDITLTLKDDRSVEMSTDYLNGKPPLVATGTWLDTGDGTAIVTLFLGPDNQPYNPPIAFTFKLEGNELVAVQYDVNLYGAAGLRFTKQ